MSVYERAVNGFRQAVSALGPDAWGLLDRVGEQEMALAGEIRLRVDSPAVISLPAGQKRAGTSLISRAQLDNMLLNLCGHSIYSHQQEMVEGYIAVEGGHRAGICGRAVLKDGKVTAVREVTGICLRVARHFSGCSGVLTDKLFRERLCSVIIAGTPASGKTTLLRDTAAGLARRGLNVSVVDERGELSLGGSGNILCGCDVLPAFPKAEGIYRAVRCLAPDVIICDEIGGTEDALAVQAGAAAGVCMICSVHAGTLADLAAKPFMHQLISCGATERIVLLEGRKNPGAIKEIIKAEELYELSGGNAGADMLGAGRF